MVGQPFGSCCETLKDALAGGEFEPLIAVGEDGVLYLSVGMVEIEDEGPGMIDHAILYCPFCGTQLQTEEEVEAKAAATEGNA